MPKQINDLKPHMHLCLVCKQQIKHNSITNIVPPVLEVNNAISNTNILDVPELKLTLALLKYQNPLKDDYLPIIQDN